MEGSCARFVFVPDKDREGRIAIITPSCHCLIGSSPTTAMRHWVMLASWPARCTFQSVGFALWYVAQFCPTLQ